MKYYSFLMGLILLTSCYKKPTTNYFRYEIISNSHNLRISFLDEVSRPIVIEGDTAFIYAWTESAKTRDLELIVEAKDVNSRTWITGSIYLNGRQELTKLSTGEFARINLLYTYTAE